MLITRKIASVDEAELNILKRHKDTLLAEVDAEAERVRLLFITGGSGQAMVYTEKRNEAESFMANPNISVNEIPHLYKEALAENTTLESKCIEILYLAEQWKFISSLIEEIRLTAKAAIKEAATFEQAEETFNQVSWAAVKNLNQT